MSPKRVPGEIRTEKIRKAAAELFLKRGYESVTLDDIVKLAGGSKGAIYADFGGKSDLFINVVGSLLREANQALCEIDYAGLDLEQSLEKLGFRILKLISSKRSVELHRLAVSEAAKMPQVGRAWYTYGPARTTSLIQEVLERHSDKLPQLGGPPERLAVALHDALIGDTLAKLLSGLGKPEPDKELRQRASYIVALVLGRHLTT